MSWGRTVDWYGVGFAWVESAHHINLRSDNTKAAAYPNRQRGVRSSILHRKVVEIQLWDIYAVIVRGRTCDTMSHSVLSATSVEAPPWSD